MVNHPKRSKKIAETPQAPEVVAPPPTVITSIKGFGPDLSCFGFKFEFGKTYTVPGEIKACSNGFHACPTDEHPLSVFEYYAPAGSRFAEVTQSGLTDRQGTKLASASITIGVELSIGDLAERAVKWVFDRANWKDGPVATGTNEGVTASGLRGAATASGYSGAATASGYSGAATATGCAGRVKGVVGCALFAVERDEKWNIISVACGIVGRDGIKADTWYSAKDGKLVEVTP